ncbi:MAG: ABC transporter ATP-binding protein/permease [Clostridia bacterium]|nr:ABC transporter ATP-binding protein/permease [Clostridia bacterium]
MLTLKEIKKDYATGGNVVHALKGVSLEFRANEFVSILGQSGCGKTTLLNIIGGLDRYTSGDLIINGVSTKNYKDGDWDVYRNHRIGFVFQSYNLIPHQTVLGNVELALTIAGVSKKERRRRAAEALKKVGLEKELKKRPNQLSGGQMQRVAIARALVNNPEILLADEPTGALDSDTSVQIMELIREIAGERLVIMVTHNPELAEKYSTRIVRLSDGLVVSDTNPYDSEAEKAELWKQIEAKGYTKEQFYAWQASRRAETDGKETAAMSYGTALGLSGRNLGAKRNRTAITSIAGSIGIIGVSLVLALSGGFNTYIANTEKDMLSAYPVEVTETTLNYASIMQTMQAGKAEVDLSKLNDKLYVNSFLTKLANNMMSTNTITQEYLDYLAEIDEEHYYDMQFLYGGNIGNNLFQEVSFSADGSGENEVTYDMSLDALLSLYQGQLETTDEDDKYGSFTMMFGSVESVTYELPDNKDYILSQYDAVWGEYPKDGEEDKLVLVLNNDGGMTDLVLMQLGLLSLDEVADLFNSDSDDATMTIDFETIGRHEYFYYPNDAIYQKGAMYGEPTEVWQITEYSSLQAPTLDETKGTPLKIGCILRAKEETAYGSLSSGLAYTKDFAAKYQADCRASAIAQEAVASGGKVEVHNIDLMTYMLENSKALAEGNSAQMAAMIALAKAKMKTELPVRDLGAAEMPNNIKIYVKDFDHKDAVTAHLDQWNEDHQDDEAAQIQYTDTVATLMTLVRSMLDAVTYVLVAFTAISLVVSSVMIGVITYVSVVERTKEIGVLRSLGARKKDIRRLFNAETFLIGLFSGVFGVGFTYAISVPINLLLGHLTGISTLAALPIHEGIIMIAVSVVLTLISGLIPAQAAAKKDPVIALRTE